jgi:hypothetical protein
MAETAWIDGRHVEMQRPSAPATEVHVGGTKWLADEMMGSGVQKPPPAHAWSSFCCAAGTSDAGRQCAAEQVLDAHEGKSVGLMMLGPLYGQAMGAGDGPGMSQPMEHAPVGGAGLGAVGS